MQSNRQMKLCLLTLGAYPVPAVEGGAVEALVELMAENFQQGYMNCSLDIITKYTAEAQERAGQYGKVSFRFIHCSAAAMKGYRLVKRVVRKLFGVTPVCLNPYFAKALRLIRKNGYDVVVIENAVWYVRPLKRHCRGRVILHLHNDLADLAGPKGISLVRQADGIVAVSDFVAENIRRGAGKMPPVVTVKNCIDTQRFRADATAIEKAKDLRERYGFSVNDTICLFVGRLIPEKGIRHLIEAIGKLDDAHIKLLVVGGTAFQNSGTTVFEESLYQKARRLGGRVVFAGYVEYQKLPVYYHACDLAVFPSQCDEAAGLVVLEAQSAGKPVVIAGAGGMPEYVCAASAKIVAKGPDFTDRLADAIRTVCQSEPLRRQVGAAGAALAEDFDKNGYLERILWAIGQIC